MTTLVCFHAHPDDETTQTAGTMAKAAADGVRTVLVVATNGEHGEPVPGVLRDGEELWQRRIEEVRRSADVLGVARVELLGYRDSGMMGEPTNDDPACFWRADVDEAAGLLAAVLRAELEQADGDVVLTIYDDHGGYGHPDHIQVHRVGVAAAALAGVTRVFEGTMNRDAMRRTITDRPPESREYFSDEDAENMRKELDEGRFGSPEADITHGVDVTAHLELKRRAMAVHESQIAADSFFLAMPDEPFAMTWGTEWFIERGVPRAPDQPLRTDLFAPTAETAGEADR